ncbi:RICIN domain-containing protein [Streptomyces sp. NPDC058084]|uniref:RICIN domain-containing protein n=1 Tax=Streptomyces sp. NPDC058084 TaxID=3346333 RepID=UPI0036ED9F1C
MIRTRTIGSALAAVALTAGTLVGSATTASAVAGPTPEFHVKNVNSNKCLLVQGPDNGNPAVQYECGYWADQKWVLDETYLETKGTYRLKNVNSGKCLLVRGLDNGNLGEQYECGPWADQLWQKVLTDDPDVYKLKNLNSGKCLVAQGFDNGSRVFQYDCEDYRDQLWRLV